MLRVPESNEDPMSWAALLPLPVLPEGLFLPLQGLPLHRVEVNGCRHLTLHASSQTQSPLSNCPRTSLLRFRLSHMGLTAVVSSPTPTLHLLQDSPPQWTIPPRTPASALGPPAHTPSPSQWVLLPNSLASPHPLGHHLNSAPSHLERPNQSPGLCSRLLPSGHWAFHHPVNTR